GPGLHRPGSRAATRHQDGTAQADQHRGRAATRWGIRARLDAVPRSDAVRRDGGGGRHRGHHRGPWRRADRGLLPGAGPAVRDPGVRLGQRAARGGLAAAKFPHHSGDRRAAAGGRRHRAGDRGLGSVRGMGARRVRLRGDPADMTVIDRPDAPARPPRQSLPGRVLAFVRNTWRGLTSMRTALVLLFLLALAAIPGALLPQRELNEGKVAEYIANRPTLGPWMDRVQLFDVFSSSWFTAIYA